MSRPKMSTWTLGAIMVIVPTSFYLGTALNRHYAFAPTPVSVPSEIHEEVAEVSQRTTAAAPATPAYTQAQVSPADEMAMLQNRLKSLKTTRMSLEMELKDNKEKLRRLEGRMKKEDKNEVIART